MALSIGVMVGDRVQIGDRSVEVVQIEHSRMATLKTDEHQLVLVSDQYTIEVVPKVRVSCSQWQGKRTKLVFEAPRDIRIERRPVEKA